MELSRKFLLIIKLLNNFFKLLNINNFENFFKLLNITINTSFLIFHIFLYIMRIAFIHLQIFRKYTKARSLEIHSVDTFVMIHQ